MDILHLTGHLLPSLPPSLPPIPNLYSADEQDQIVNTMRPYIQEQGLQPTKANLMAAYTGRVRNNIHMVLCMRYMYLLLNHTGASGM